MRLKLSELHEPLRSRIQAQLAADASRALVRSVEAHQPKPDEKALECVPPKHQGRARGLGACIVSLSLHGRRRMDDDNLVASLKPLRDAIARSLGVDDGDRRVVWQYGQTETRGQQGVIVSLECL